MALLLRACSPVLGLLTLRAAVQFRNSGLQVQSQCPCSTSSAAALDDEQKRVAMGKKLLYRSKQRGFLELDLLVGLWAEREVPNMDMPSLQNLSILLDQENPDLFKWLTGQLEPPKPLVENPVFRAMYHSVQEQLADSPLATRATAGATWVRGWDDSWRSPGQSSATTPAHAT